VPDVGVPTGGVAEGLGLPKAGRDVGRAHVTRLQKANGAGPYSGD
jgi:hypothetical protein